MSNNNNKQPLDLTESLPVFDKAQAPSTTNPTVNKLDYVGINFVEMSSVKPREENDSLGVPGINQPDVTTRNLSHSDEASTSTPIIDRITEVNQTPYDVDESDDETIGFFLDCAEKGYSRGKQRPPSICKVSRILRDHNESSFTPQLVSIGPIHREDEKLKEFEWLKGCYLDDILNRSNNATPKKTLEACLLKVNTLIDQIRESYADAIKNYSDVELARMMVMDGCFILEFCFKFITEKRLPLPNKVQNWRISKDLMLLENQVPFFVLQALFDCLPPYMVLEEVSVTLSRVLDRSLAHFVKLFLSDSTHFHSDSTHEHDHVLGYLHKHYQLEVVYSSPEDTAFHSAVELDRSGMKFKPHQEDGWSMTIKFQSSLFPCLPWFWSKPTLLMPALVIEDDTELILRNLIAYEQCFRQDRCYFTSYAYAMDMLIDTQEDIAKLVESKVLVNNLGSNKEAADMINKICKNMYLSDFCYDKAFKQMDTYYNGFWPKHIARLRRVYFSNPWSVIALLVGFIVFVATVVSAIFAILDYFR